MCIAPQTREEACAPWRCRGFERTLLLEADHSKLGVSFVDTLPFIILSLTHLRAASLKTRDSRSTLQSRAPFFYNQRRNMATKVAASIDKNGAFVRKGTSHKLNFVSTITSELYVLAQALEMAFKSFVFSFSAYRSFSSFTDPSVDSLSLPHVPRP